MFNGVSKLLAEPNPARKGAVCIFDERDRKAEPISSDMNMVWEGRFAQSQRDPEMVVSRSHLVSEGESQ